MISLNIWSCLNTDWKLEEELVSSPCEKHKALHLEEVAFCRTRDKAIASCSVKDWEVKDRKLSMVGQR